MPSRTFSAFVCSLLLPFLFSLLVGKEACAGCTYKWRRKIIYLLAGWELKRASRSRPVARATEGRGLRVASRRMEIGRAGRYRWITPSTVLLLSIYRGGYGTGLLPRWFDAIRLGQSFFVLRSGLVTLALFGQFRTRKKRAGITTRSWIGYRARDLRPI